MTGYIVWEKWAWRMGIKRYISTLAQALAFVAGLGSLISFGFTCVFTRFCVFYTLAEGISLFFFVFFVLFCLAAIN